MRRISELDAVRGLAALAVVVHHDFFLSGALSPEFVGHVRSTPLQALVSGRPFVLLFFVLSGFVLSRSLKHQRLTLQRYTVWMTQRSIRLILPAFASVALSAILYLQCVDPEWQAGLSAHILKASWTTTPATAAIVGQGLLTTVPDFNHVLWSLAVEWRLSFLLPLMVAVATLRSRQGWLILLLGSVGLGGLAGGTWSYVLGFRYDLLGSVQSFAYFVLPFAIGVVLDHSGVCERRVDRLTVWASLFACLGLIRIPNDMGAFLAAAALIWTVQQPSLLQSALRIGPLLWLGRISFSLYLVHLPLTVAIFHVWHGQFTSFQLGALATVAAIPAAWLFYHLVEHPSQALARAVTARRAESATGQLQAAA